ncbi:hypothetical protein [Geobacillus sp. WSUCF-018B]|uniref:hypothetical protein n=1 Tax=Geobacillus sp. WSUCF-018B TaxID=2055939 RepID=UPI001E3AE3D3|nr:hypothetical protein [Geobacillus sp. WSUCF-018B]
MEQQTMLKEILKALDLYASDFRSQIAALNEKIETMDKKVETLDKKVEAIDKKVEAMNGEFKSITPKITPIHQKHQKTTNDNRNKKSLETLWLKRFHSMIPTGLEPATSTLSIAFSKNNLILLSKLDAKKFDLSRFFSC